MAFVAAIPQFWAGSHSGQHLIAALEIYWSTLALIWLLPGTIVLWRATAIEGRIMTVPSLVLAILTLAMTKPYLACRRPAGDRHDFTAEPRSGRDQQLISSFYPTMTAHAPPEDTANK
jgi:hypothetical protein